MAFDDDGNPIGLTKKIKKKYAKAQRVFEMGIWGSDIDSIKCMTLTTKMGSETRTGKSRNTWSQLVRDNRNLRIALRKAGVLAEDCFCVEVSPVNHLLHMHGFYRLRAPLYAADLHGIVTEQWEKSHGAKVVWVKDMWDMKGAIKYDVKHALKNYLDEGYSSMRILKSKGWLPTGWRKAEKAIVRWALTKTGIWLEENDKFYEEGWNDDYLYNRWGVVSDLIKRWCYGEEVYLETRHCVELVWGTKISIMEKINEI